MLRGALQVAASRLLDQSSQASKGHHELFEGVIGWHRINEEVNATLRQKAPRRRKPIKL
jgi:hypothetical protein